MPLPCSHGKAISSDYFVVHVSEASIDRSVCRRGVPSYPGVPTGQLGSRDNDVVMQSILGGLSRRILPIAEIHGISPG